MKLTLADTCEFINGGAWSDQEYVEQGIPVVKVTNMVAGTIELKNMNYLPLSSYGKYKKHELHTSDLIVSTVGSHPTQPGSVVGKTSVVPPHLNGAFLNQNTVCIRVKRKDLICPKFLIYTSKTILFKHHIESRARGSANQVRMALGELKKFTFGFPPLAIQQKIAAVLSAYDDLIENNDRRITLLEKMAEEIYREWFVRLRFPGFDRATFHKGIPEGWEIKKLEDVVELAYGKALREEDRISGNYPVFGSGGVVGTHKSYLVKAPGIIVGRKGNVGSVHWSEQDFYPIDTVYYIKSDLSFYFLFFLVQSLNFINNDAAVPGLNRNQAYSNKFYLPPQFLINKYAENVKNIFNTKNNLKRKNELLKQTRDRLLTRLISGKLSVEDLDIQFPPSMTTDA